MFYKHLSTQIDAFSFVFKREKSACPTLSWYLQADFLHHFNDKFYCGIKKLTTSCSTVIR